MARPLALAAAITASLLALAGAGGAATQQSPKRGGTLVYAQPTPEPACLNLFFSQCIPGTSWLSLARVYNLVLPGAFDVGPTVDSRPRLVSRIDYSRRPPYTLTYRIRPEARWSDGVPVSARDFVFTHRARVEEIPPEWADPHRTSVRSVRAVDAKTVRVVLRSRIGGLQNALFSEVLPEHVLRGRDLADVWTTRIDDPRTGRPIGTGPFLVHDFERGKQLTLVRNPRYWGPHTAYLDRLVLRFDVDGDEMLGSVSRGQVDVAWGFPLERLAEFRSRSTRIVTTPGTNWEHLSIRLGPEGHPALGDKRLRRALAFGIDRVALARAAFGDVDPRIRPSDSAVFLVQSRDYRPNWSGYGLRRAEARRLLGQAGCRPGSDAIYVCAGRRLSFVLATHFTGATSSIRTHTVELVQAQLRRIGVEVRPVYVPSPTWFGLTGYAARGEWDLALFGYVLGPGSETGFHDKYACGGSDNLTGYCQRLATRDLDQARRILHPRERARVLNRADVQLAKDVPVLPLYQLPTWAAVRPQVQGFALSAFAPQLLNAEDWWLDR